MLPGMQHGTRHPALFSRALLLCLLALCACAAPSAEPTAKVLLFGEQHDQPDQQRQVAAAVQGLAESGRLAAVVLEMAEEGRSTAALPREADEARVREALAWAGWPWDAYSGVVMRAVRAGVPVFGGNLPRATIRAAMLDTGLDAAVDERARANIAGAVREGHCGLLPSAQEPGMVRTQIARDRAMAQTLERVLAQAPANQGAVLLAGAQHASRDRGVPVHLASGGKVGASAIHVVMFGSDRGGLSADEWRPAAFTPRPDPCEEFRQRLQRPSAAASAAP